MIYDYCIIGGGIVGLATAMALLERQPGASLLILEKENVLARHQTGHNSGVIHAGIYYAPGSLKADLCKRGAQATKDFCTQHQIKFEVCGKLLVASTPLEVERMHALYERSQQNGLKVEQLDAKELQRREPNIVGLGGLFLDATGIVDYKQVCEAMARVIQKAGGEVQLQTRVRAIVETADKVTISSDDKVWSARQLVACAGLQSDRLAALAGVKIDHQIVPFRGEYFRLPAAKNNIVNHLIYPIPDPELPFLGVHLTRMIDGSVTVGPNAVLGLGRENYRKFSINWRDVAEYATFPGFWKTIWNNLGSGTTEMKNSLFKRGYLEQCRKYCPSLEVDDLLPYEAGIRAQAVMRDGTLVHDFLFAETPRMVHVCNAPSPAATSAIPIGQMIAERIRKAR
ncbi:MULTISPECIES: L-2-hydroxyglutarate oxidase [Pseudomonas]|uniref:L-2-hydroxyglutarate oxidase n=1 Tax=Pseudomonas chlororaphis subsp. aureofaciens TaxID=587851 RepID=A0AAD0ZI55_9PSED|nr:MULTISPECIES: L-2-hydroxyglutarate oxidase [Pseudomonas]AZE23269.1 L-2-hydroxyglutarate oxidase [Pseudomonas chlororaphis subsp. aureofaciens]AZE29563.1 L-2-hydroxyglutarate oxidase [Pseudomonas chlororaphis subsp. aureofaciens]AZE35866.1 L-2-hydroxyglutarate oxidase [Pseudomonas chlororaphis subsp. aureofaciens]AZE42210.1 L-2-hydroxyglutarate oxidase [Pseudomonas chlororaphis subsp. aureofaciens]POA72702.1 L-2-hydroxyglutarate oxidase [Pseudomonas sp. GW531-T4]